MKRRKLSIVLGLALAAGGALVATPIIAPTQVQSAIAQQSATVTLNGQPLATSIPPAVENGRTLVPMRDIFEALGATVNWNAGDQSISALRGDTNIWLQIGNGVARVNDQSATLDQSPVIRNGSTLVPLRFVSEALGAQVNWDGASRVVGITSNAAVADAPEDSGQQVAGIITVPENAVVPVVTETELSSKTARVGDTFWTKVKSERVGDSEFPPGTDIKGEVVQVSPMKGDEPGSISIDFTGIQFPNGQRRSIQGSLISLDKDNIDQTSSGRMIAKNKKSGGADAKTVLIGAGAGWALGRLLKQNGVISAAIGAVGGYLYGNSQKDKEKVQDVKVPAGTTLGVRLDRPVSYEDSYGYRNDRSPYLQ